jgi:hypothetical protein
MPPGVLRHVKTAAGKPLVERDAIDVLRAGTKERPLARTKELRDRRSKR